MSALPDPGDDLDGVMAAMEQSVVKLTAKLRAVPQGMRLDQELAAELARAVEVQQSAIRSMYRLIKNLRKAQGPDA